ncbi:MAG: hypothetical protein ASARMPREDX12_003434 [Alectoria sarmentosa]|nr:MAG: hypothetical protein ASARMPREDX12_003434 [Alectoria sarmentosa]
MSQQAPAGGHPTPFNTNVNRAKTKKWVEAKSYSYDGDDWGDVDDYDEYGGYDDPEPEPAPEAKPTGLRQRGQSASQMPQDPYSVRQDPYQSPVDTRIYGNMGGTLGRQQQQQQQQQQYGSRSVTNPQPQAPAMRRKNSFDPEDERRAFSAGGLPQSVGNTDLGTQSPSQRNQGQNVAAHDFQSDQNYPNQRPQGQPSPARPSVHTPSRPSMEGLVRDDGQPQQQAGKYQSKYSDQPGQSNTSGRTQSMASTNSALDFHNRRDFSPSAMPPPLQTRGSPSPHSVSSSSHPPRKSSMSQETVPGSNSGAQAQPFTGTGDTEDDLSPARERAASGAGKALPFVRPADIYRRMQEEKQKEQQSQDSVRPSMDINMGKSNERPDLGNPQDSEASQRLKPTLDPVTERKSEYGSEGVNLNEQPKSEERRPTTSKKFELPNRKSNPRSQVTTDSLQSMLPDVSRVSGFGESLFGSSSGSQEPSQEPLMKFAGPTVSAPAQEEQNQATPEKDLRNQPSLGFTSAVHEAFDRAEDQVPPTPSSAAGSTVGRSTSGGTSAVSPIISRGPSTATDNWNSSLSRIDDVTTPTTNEAPEGSSSRPMSSSSLGTPKQFTRKPSASLVPMPLSTDLPSPSFVPGHRKDLSTPSPDNSPARTPALEVNRQLRQPQEVELAAATPTDPSFSTINTTNGSEVAEQEPNSAHPTEILSRGSPDLHVDTQLVAKNFSGKAELAGSPIPYPQNYLRTRTGSGSSSRVRDLADKFESGSRPGSAHSTTPRSSVFGNTMQKEDIVLSRPLADRMESFRPHLPGGWESSASIAPAAALRRPEPAMNRTQPDSIAATGGPRENTAPSADEAPSSMSQIKDASEEAFTAVAAAGTALAGAFAAAVGMDKRDGPEASTAETPSDEQVDEGSSKGSGAATHKRNASMDTFLNPEATKSYLTDPMDDEALTAAPTPLPKDTSLHRTQYSETQDYFSPAEKREPLGPAGQSETTEPANRPSMLPSLSTDTMTPQYESDRLRREIVRELSPMVPSEPTTAQSDYSNYQDASASSTNQSLPRPSHESGVLPREYESYWNDVNSDEDTSHFSSEPGRLEDATTARRQQGAAIVGEPLHPRRVDQEASAGEPLRSGRLEQDVPSAPTSTGEGLQDSPQVLQHRFSWEQPLQSPNLIPAGPNAIHESPIAPVSAFPRSVDYDTIHEVPDAPVSEFLRSAVYPEGQSFQPQDRLKIPQLSTLPNSADAFKDDDPGLIDQDALSPESQTDLGQHDETAGAEKDLPGYKPGLEVAPSPTEKEDSGQMEPGYGDGTNYLGQESPMLQSEQRQQLEPSLPEPPVHESSQMLGTQDDDFPPLPSPIAQPKIPAFREILALKSPSERIRAYDETREQFANLNTGLAHWLAITANDLPEHADVLTNYARRPAFQAHKPSPSRSKLGGLLQSGSHSSQPNPQSAPDGALGNPSPHGYSPSGGSSGKLSSQQVQAKGKDLLHTAGVFGGKANVAAKGLFSKGKSKLRGSSGAEKDLRTDFDKITAHPTNPSHQEALALVSKDGRDSAVKEIPYQHVTPQKAVIQIPSQEPELLPQNSEQRQPRDTPSLESFTESQEGDDERSEESTLTNQGHPLRASSLYLKGISSQRQSRSQRFPAAIEEAPISLKETPLKGSYVGSPKEVQTPRSAASSNKTPTQATFTDAGQPAMPADFPVIIHGTTVQDYRDAEPSLRSFSQPQSDFSNLASSNNYRDQEPETIPRFSQDSEGTFHTAGSKDGLPETSLPTLQNPQNQPAGLDPYSRVLARMNMPNQSGKSQRNLSHSPIDSQNSRPVSLIRDSPNAPIPSQNYSSRGPSIDSDPGRTNFDHPPSPLTPRQPTNYRAPEQRGRTGPLHYGTDHDFDQPSDTERSRSRSPSYPRQLQDIRRSQDSRPSLDPNILEHPAFRAVAEGNGMPAQYYGGQLTAEENLIPRQRTSQHMLVGRGPIVGKRSESKSRSRRGSRSSAFFKAFTNPSKSDHPPLPNAPDSQASSSPRNSPAVGDRRSERLSIFRSRSGNMGSGSGDSHSKENMAPRDASPRSSFTQVAHQLSPMTPRRVQEDNSSKGVSSKWSKKLQRASTSAKPEPDSGKKKRFSAIGTLFGGRKRQGSTLQSGVSPQQSFPQSFQQLSPAQAQQRDLHNSVQPQKLERSRYGSPWEEHIQPPREGYYAPGRQDRGSLQAADAYRSPNSGSRQNGQSFSRAPDAPAYVQDSALRVRQLMSPVEQPQNAAMPRTSATFPLRNPQHSSSSVPRSSTAKQTNSGEAFPQRPEHQTKASGSSWTRFSTHARSKSRQEQARSSQPPQSYAPAPPSNSSATGQRSFPEPVRSESPPPPPPPPKDDWHHPRPRDSSGLSPSTTNQHAHHSPSPSQSSLRLVPTQQRQSLPPLQTDVRNNKSRKSTIGSGRTLTPEEKRKSRQLEIERSSIPPQSPARSVPRYVQDQEVEDEEPVMSATSFPGQMWQPSYAHWDE